MQNIKIGREDGRDHLVHLELQIEATIRPINIIQNVYIYI